MSRANPIPRQETGLFAEWVAPLPASYSNHLATPQPQRARLPWRPAVVLTLLMLTAAPRIVTAYRAETICPDGALYVRLAKAMEQGHLEQALAGLHLNTFPVVLAAGHWLLGWDWDLVGRWWGVLAATLAVWPMFAWVRRQFDDRIAVAACLLYAAHPKLIEWSPEVIRDPTYWLLFVGSLALLWRAVTEVRLHWFLLAGVTSTLCVLTRFEGLFLLIPLVLWTAMRWFALRESRGRLLVGALLCAGAFPALLLVVNIWLLSGHAQFEAFRAEPFDRAAKWFTALLGAAPGEAESALSNLDLAWLFVDAMFRGITPLFLLLLFGGYFARRSVWDRSDHVPLFLVTIAVMAGVWIHIWFAHVGSSRYALTIVLLSTRCAGLGLLTASSWVSRMLVRNQEHPGRIAWIHAAAVALLLASGNFEALRHHDQQRELRAALGRWVQVTYGSDARVVCTEDIAYLIAHYNLAQPQGVVAGTDPQTLLYAINRVQPDVVALSRDRLPPEAIAAVEAHAQDWGLAATVTPEGSCPPNVFLRVRPLELRQARQPDANSAR